MTVEDKINNLVELGEDIEDKDAEVLQQIGTAIQEIAEILMIIANEIKVEDV